MKVKTDITKVTIIFSDVNKKLGLTKAARSGPTSTTLSGLFRGAAFVRVRLMSNLSLEKVRFVFKCDFNMFKSSAAFSYTISTIVGFLPRSSHDDPGTPILHTCSTSTGITTHHPTTQYEGFFFDCSLPRP